MLDDWFNTDSKRNSNCLWADERKVSYNRSKPCKKGTGKRQNLRKNKAGICLKDLEICIEYLGENKELPYALHLNSANDILIKKEDVWKLLDGDAKKRRQSSERVFQYWLTGTYGRRIPVGRWRRSGMTGRRWVFGMWRSLSSFILFFYMRNTKLEKSWNSITENLKMSKCTKCVTELCKAIFIKSIKAGSWLETGLIMLSCSISRTCKAFDWTLPLLFFRIKSWGRYNCINPVRKIKNRSNGIVSKAVAGCNNNQSFCTFFSIKPGRKIIFPKERLRGKLCLPT